jgi:hypothetical protein
MHRVGSVMLEQLLNADEGDYRGRTLPCDKGHDAEFKLIFDSQTAFSPSLTV